MKHKYVIIDSSKENHNAVDAKFKVQIPRGITGTTRVCVKSFSMPNSYHNIYGDLIKTAKFVEFYRPTPESDWVYEVFSFNLKEGYTETDNLFLEIQSKFPTRPKRSSTVLTRFSMFFAAVILVWFFRCRFEDPDRHISTAFEERPECSRLNSDPYRQRSYPKSASISSGCGLAAIAAPMSFSFSTPRRTVRPSVCTPPWGERSQARGGAPCTGKGKGESASTVTNLGPTFC